jgi:hypothetical protein
MEGEREVGSGRSGNARASRMAGYMFPRAQRVRGARKSHSGGGERELPVWNVGGGLFRSSGRFGACDRVSHRAINGEGASSHGRNAFSNGAGSA